MTDDDRVRGGLCSRCFGAEKVWSFVTTTRTETVWLACPACQPGPHPRPVSGKP